MERPWLIKVLVFAVFGIGIGLVFTFHAFAFFWEPSALSWIKCHLPHAVVLLFLALTTALPVPETKGWMPVPETKGWMPELFGIQAGVIAVIFHTIVAFDFSLLFWNCLLGTGNLDREESIFCYDNFCTLTVLTWTSVALLVHSTLSICVFALSLANVLMRKTPHVVGQEKQKKK